MRLPNPLLLLFSHSCVSLWDPVNCRNHLTCSSLSPGVCSNSRPFSQWCHPTILPSVTCFFSCTPSFPASVFSSEVALCIWWPKYWSFNFSISPPNEYSGLISFRIDWFDLLYVQRTLKSLLAPELKNISPLERSCHYLYHRVYSLL